MKPLATLALLAASLAHASVIGQWDGDGKAVTLDNSNISWNWPQTSYTYSTSMVRDLMTGYGSTIGPDAPITASALAGYDAFVIRIPPAAPTAVELAALSDWVSSGGLLLLFGDSSMNTAPANAILSGVGSTMSFGGTVNQNFFYTAGLFLTEGAVDSFISPTVGRGVSGGTSLTRGGAAWTTSQQAQAASYIHFEQLGLGYAVAFADTIDVNYVLNGNGSALDRMFKNIADYVNPHGPAGPPPPPPPPPPPTGVPEPSTFLLASAGLSALAAFARRRTQATI